MAETARDRMLQQVRGIVIETLNESEALRETRTALRDTRAMTHKTLEAIVRIETNCGHHRRDTEKLNTTVFGRTGGNGMAARVSLIWKVFAGAYAILAAAFVATYAYLLRR